MKDFIRWADGRNFVSVRAMTMYVAMWMTWESYLWAARFADMTDRTSIEVAAIIAAVTAPISGLMGYIFRWYVEGSKQ